MINDELHRAARSYVAAALDYLRERDGLFILGGTTEWVRVENYFELRPRVDPAPDTLSHAAGVHALPEFEALREVLRSDGTITGQLGGLVGTALGGGRSWDAEQLADGFLVETVGRTGELTMNDEAFDRAYRRLEDALYATEFEFSLIMPIPQLESDALPVPLEAKTELALLDDREILACLQAGVLRPMAGIMPIVFVDGLAGLRHRFGVAKVVGSFGHGHQETAIATVEGLRDLPDRIVQTLRLLKEGKLSVPGFVYFGDDWFNRGATMFQMLGPTDPMPLGAFSLDKAEAAEVRQLWIELSDERVRKHKTLSLALRRFSYAGDRHRADDRLVDLMIAGEALFLPDEYLELGYKLALRTAFFLEASGYDRRETFTHMKAAYRARGDIVHGSQPKKLTLPDGTETTQEGFSDRTADYLRAALKRAMQIVCEAQEGTLSDFDILILR